MLSNSRSHWSALFCALYLGLAAPSGFAEAPVTVPGQIAQAIPNPRLAGEGALRFYGFHIYDAQFWVGENGYRPDAPDAAPFALDVKYAHHFSGKSIAKISLDEFERLGAGTPEQRQQWYEELVHLLPDVDNGQHLTGVFEPQGGMSLYSDGSLLGSVPDKEFARAFFSIWLDPRTKAPDLREKLLANAAAHR